MASEDVPEPAIGEPSTAISVSVVIATYRRPALLERCLRALLAQGSAPSFEIVVADDGCEASVETLVDSLASQHRNVLIRYLPVPDTRGPAAARNRGWHAARGAIVAFTDDDTIPCPGWIAAGYRALAARTGCPAVSGVVSVPVPVRPTDHQRDTGGLANAEFVTANCFVRREALERVDGFDERFTRAWREDSDLQFRLMERAGPIGHAADAVVEHPVRHVPWGSSIAAQAKVYFDALLYKKHPRLYRSRIRPVPPWHYYIMVLALLGAIVAPLAGEAATGLACLVVWFGLTTRFCLQRLKGAALTPSHVAEMIVTSVLIPPLSLYWRLRGAFAYRVWFL